MLAIGSEERREFLAGVQVLDEFAYPSTVGRARTWSERLAIKPPVVSSKNVSGQRHARILSEPPDGNLDAIEPALSAV